MDSPNLGTHTRRFQHIEDARQFALQQRGSEQIRQSTDGFVVETLPPTVSHLNLSETLQHQTAQAQEVLEFLIDTQDDGIQTTDQRYTTSTGKISSPQRLSAYSENLRSPEQKGLALIREAMNGSKDRLLDLSPRMITAVLISQQTTSEEKAFIDSQLNSAPAQIMHQTLTKWLGPDSLIRQAGAPTFDSLIERLNQSENRHNLDTLYDLAQYPERFSQQFQNQESALSSMADTLQALPGLRRYPAGRSTQNSDLKQDQRNFEHILRQVKQYNYDLQLSTGLQFNRNGIAQHDSQIDYRHGGQVFSLGFGGRDFNLNGPWGQGFGYENNASQAAQRLRLGYASGSFDLRLGLARHTDGKISLERPESDAADRYLARKGDEVKDWAKAHPWQTAGIALGAAGAAWAYSYANPDQDLALDFNQRFDVFNHEFVNVRAEISPELHLKGGNPDLGVRRVGIGASGHFRDHSYDFTLRQNFKNTTLGSGNINPEDTEFNLRYGYRNHALTLDQRYQGETGQWTTQMAYRKDTVHSASLSSFVQPYVNLQNGTYQNAGISSGLSKDFGGGLQGQINVDYNEQSGVSGGFRVVKQFDW